MNVVYKSSSKYVHDITPCIKLKQGKQVSPVVTSFLFPFI